MDKIQNKNICRVVRVALIVYKMWENWLIWFGHWRCRLMDAPISRLERLTLNKIKKIKGKIKNDLNGGGDKNFEIVRFWGKKGDR